jgi:SAM-dependent methyltransferase
MMKSQERPEIVARFYDTIFSKLRGVDKGYYLKKIAQTKGPVLEIGVGTGRIFCDALKMGADIYGIDTSSSMIEKLKEKIDPEEYHRVHVQDAIHLQFQKDFDLIIAPFRVFSHFLTVNDQLAVLERVHDHLRPQGRFLFDVFVPNLSMLVEDANKRLDFDGEYEPGKTLNQFSSTKVDPVKQVIQVTMTFSWDEEDKEMRGQWSFPFRYFFRYELEHLIHRSKLDFVCIYGDFLEKEPNANSQDYIVACSRS